MNGWGNERMEALWIYFLMILLAGILSLVLCIFSYLKLRNAPGGRFYTIVTLLSAIFSFAYALELSSHTLEEIKLWLGIEYLVMPFIPSFILLMCLEYSSVKLRLRFVFLLFAIPLITIFAHHTNELHHLYYTSVKAAK